MSTLSESVFDPRGSGRIIIVEDEPLIAESLRADLVDAGFAVVGMASRVDKAIKLLKDFECDAVILDANLAGTSSAPVAAILAARKIPCLVLSGYARDQLPAEFSEAIYVQKPYRIRELVIELAGIAFKKQ
jgi:DNA-binding response OmpR family regulator